MRTHIYAFGSICRGEVTPGSDIDLLACTHSGDNRFDAQVYSIYTHKRLEELWKQGNPFAWHLAIESRLIFSSDGADFLRDLGRPADYNNGKSDCLKFRELFLDSRNALQTHTNSQIFNLSSIFLSIRNIATCFSLTFSKPVFSRRSAFMIEPSVPLTEVEYSLLENARILATRGIGSRISDQEIQSILPTLDPVDDWMQELIMKVHSS